MRIINRAMDLKVNFVSVFRIIAFLIFCIVVILIYNYSISNRQNILHGKKFNEKGEYIPFYGYTSLALLHKDAQPLCEAIEHFIQLSSLRNYFSALPARTYHMTIFDIYAISRKAIPPVKRWMDDTRNDLPEIGWLPEEVLKRQHEEARISFRNVSKQTHILATEQWGRSVLAVRLKLDAESDKELHTVRNRLAEIYEHSDDVIEGDGKILNWHVTLAYRYKELPSKNSKEWTELTNDISYVLKLASGIRNYTLVNHGIYYFNSMTNFIPIEFFGY